MSIGNNNFEFFSLRAEGKWVQYNRLLLNQLWTLQERLKSRNIRIRQEMAITQMKTLEETELKLWNTLVFLKFVNSFQVCNNNFMKIYIYSNCSFLSDSIYRFSWTVKIILCPNSYEDLFNTRHKHQEGWKAITFYNSGLSPLKFVDYFWVVIYRLTYWRSTAMLIYISITNFLQTLQCNYLSLLNNVHLICCTSNNRKFFNVDFFCIVKDTSIIVMLVSWSYFICYCYVSVGFKHLDVNTM